MTPTAERIVIETVLSSSASYNGIFWQELYDHSRRRREDVKACMSLCVALLSQYFADDDIRKHLRMMPTTISTMHYMSKTYLDNQRQAFTDQFNSIKELLIDNLKKVKE